MTFLTDLISKIDKKKRAIALSIIMGLYIYLASDIFNNVFFVYRYGVGLLILALSLFVAHYPNIHYKYFIFALIMPTHLLAGALMVLKYFPNLGNIFTLIIISGVMIMYYIIVLVDNIFFVVEDRGELIPLYRPALAWCQILMITLAIPLYAGIFKIPVNVFIQTGLIALSAFIFNMYQLWVYRHEERITQAGVGERLLLSFFGGFLTVLFAGAASFIPTEAFLQGLVASTALMFSLVYISGHIKNEINRKLVLEYFTIILVFLLFAFLFR